MADDGSKQNAVWPLPKFRFEVDLGDEIKNASFQEITGLERDPQIIEYRAGDSKAFSTIKMPGITKVGNITMKHGVFVHDNAFWDWFNTIKMNTIKRRTIVIKLLDEAGKPTMQWALSNAWPTKIASTDLKSDGNEVAIDTIEIAYEQLSTSNG